MNELFAEYKSLESLLASRTYLYTLFHKLLGGTPNAEVIETLLGPEVEDALRYCLNDDAVLRHFSHFLSDYANNMDRCELLEKAKNEYTRLFIGPAALPTPTWESPYHTRELTFFQENTLVVRRLYREKGLQPKKMQRVPDDHVALMCSFAAHQARYIWEKMSAGDLASSSVELRNQHVFLSEHMTSWLPAFAEGVRVSKTAVLYPQLIEALAAFAARDIVFLNEAAWWAENLSTAAQADLSAYVRSQSKSTSFAESCEKSLKSLEALMPFGIEENELTRIS